MKFVQLLRIKWSRFLRFWRNRRLLKAWAVQLADELTQYDIGVESVEGIESALSQLELKIETATAGVAMTNLFRTPPAGPFQRRMVEGEGANR